MGKVSKVVVCGQTSSGKTGVLEQLIYGNHVIGQQTFSTIEDTYIALIEIPNVREKEKVIYYDTAGVDISKPELPKHLTSVADGFVLVYDVTNPDSFKCVQKLKKEIDRCGRDRKEGTIIVLGNKVDLADDRLVDTATAMSWATKEKVQHYEVTVKNRQSLTEGFVHQAWKMVQPPPKSSFPFAKKVKGVTSSADT